MPQNFYKLLTVLPLMTYHYALYIVIYTRVSLTLKQKRKCPEGKNYKIKAHSTLLHFTLQCICLNMRCAFFALPLLFLYSFIALGIILISYFTHLQWIIFYFTPFYFIFILALLQYNWHKVDRHVKCTSWQFDICIHCERTPPFWILFCINISASELILQLETCITEDLQWAQCPSKPPTKQTTSQFVKQSRDSRNVSRNILKSH